MLSTNLVVYKTNLLVNLIWRDILTLLHTWSVAAAAGGVNDGRCKELENRGEEQSREGTLNNTDT